MTENVYRILEGEPSQVADACNQACASGWQLNGQLHMLMVGERAVAFQGIVRDQPRNPHRGKPNVPIPNQPNNLTVEPK